MIEKFTTLFNAIRKRLQYHIDWWIESEFFMGDEDYDRLGATELNDELDEEESQAHEKS